MELIGYLASILIGFVLGLIGGGGSILTIPMLVYLFEIEAQLATTYSLFIVGISAATGVYSNYRERNLHFSTALYFAVPSVFSLLIVRKLILPKIPESFIILNNITLFKNKLILVCFGLLMISAAIFMIKTRIKDNHTINHENKRILAIIGFSMGFIIGVLGAGGGFLIIPSLLLFSNLNMKQSVGTSLLIISINSFIGFSNDIMSGVVIDFMFLTKIATLAIIGMFIGTAFAKKLDGNQLKPIFGWTVLLMGIYIIIKELN